MIKRNRKKVYLHTLGEKSVGSNPRQSNDTKVLNLLLS